jgi:predicted protein tyrosine phosphatase
MSLVEQIEQELNTSSNKSHIIQLKRRLKKARLEEYNSSTINNNNTNNNPSKQKHNQQQQTQYSVPTEHTPIDPLDYLDVSLAFPSYFKPQTLYLGSYRLVSTIMQRNKTYTSLHINHVLNISKKIVGVEEDQRFTQLRINVKDRPTEDLKTHFPQTNQFLDKCLYEKNQKVLVHCRQGASRSVTIVVAYILHKMFQPSSQGGQPLNVRENVATIVSKLHALRSVVKPNVGFVQQLISYHNDLIIDRLLNIMFGHESGKSGYRIGINECIERLGQISNNGVSAVVNKALQWLQVCSTRSQAGRTSTTSSTSSTSTNSSTSSTSTKEERQCGRLSVVIVQSMRTVLNTRGIHSLPGSLLMGDRRGDNGKTKQQMNGNENNGNNIDMDYLSHVCTLLREGKVPHACYGLLIKEFELCITQYMTMNEIMNVALSLLHQGHYSSFDNMIRECQQQQEWEMDLGYALLTRIGHEKMMNIFIHAAEQIERSAHHPATIPTTTLKDTTFKDTTNKAKKETASASGSGGSGVSIEAPMNAMISLFKSFAFTMSKRTKDSKDSKDVKETTTTTNSAAVEVALAIVRRVQKSRLSGRTKRCYKLIGTFGLNLSLHFPLLHFEKQASSLKWMLLNQHYDLLQDTVESQERTPATILPKETSDRKKSTSSNQESNKESEIAGRGKSLVESVVGVVPWPMREWLVRTLSKQYDVHNQEMTHNEMTHKKSTQSESTQSDVPSKISDVKALDDDDDVPIIVLYHSMLWKTELEENNKVRQRNGLEAVQFSFDTSSCSTMKWYEWIDENYHKQSTSNSKLLPMLTLATVHNSTLTSPDTARTTSVSTTSVNTTSVSTASVSTTSVRAGPFELRLVNTSQGIKEMCSQCLSSENNNGVLAFDFEWHPSSNSIDVGQFAIGKMVYVVDVYRLKKEDNLQWLHLMETFVTTDNKKLVGFGVSGDLKMLSKMKNTLAMNHSNNTTSTNTSSSSSTTTTGGKKKKKKSSKEMMVLHRGASNLVDLQTYQHKNKKNEMKSKTKKSSKNNNSLAKMVGVYFDGRRLDKTCTMSDWRRRPLGKPQIEYAALDAIVCLLIYEHLIK